MIIWIWIISGVLALSVLINVILLWYITALLKKLFSITEETKLFVEDLNTFHEHLEHVHSLDVYYGDETLGSMLDHSKKIKERVIDYRDSFSFQEIGEAIETEEE